jgi:hypothetical protein
VDFSPYKGYSNIRCSCNDNSTKLIEIISNKHLSSISYMKLGHVGGKNGCFMTANKYMTKDISVRLIILTRTILFNLQTNKVNQLP